MTARTNGRELESVKRKLFTKSTPQALLSNLLEYSKSHEAAEVIKQLTNRRNELEIVVEEQEEKISALQACVIDFESRSSDNAEYKTLSDELTEQKELVKELEARYRHDKAVIQELKEANKDLEMNRMNSIS